MITRARTTVEILDGNLGKVAEIRNLYPINRGGFVLRYSKELSDYGECLFRVSTKDPLFDQVGDILVPHQYHIRVKRGNETVWAGAIIDNPQRNKNYVEVRGAEYEFYLDKLLIRRDTTPPTGFSANTDNWKHYRTFSSGTMASAVQTLITNAATDFGTVHPLGSMTTGAIDSPDYPAGFTDSNGAALTGDWNFSSSLTLRFDYHSVAYVLKAFGLYTNCDYEVTLNRVFNFKEFIGNKQTGVTFAYGTHGNVVDYNLPRLGKRMVNDSWGIAADEDGTILHANRRDEASIQQYGILQGATAYADVKDSNLLGSRLSEELQFTKSPTDAPINVVLSEKAYPLGLFDIGDIVTVKVKDNVIDFNQARRVVGITVQLHNTGRELTTVQTNAPRARDVGGP